MNFFKRQDEARRSSRRLVALFVLAVIAVVTAVNLVVFFVLSLGQTRGRGEPPPPLAEWIVAHPEGVLLITIIVIAIISLSSLYKIHVLGGGGGVVARTLGGVRVAPDTTDAQQRRLLNIVEEISIASGVPMPEIYILEQEEGINAFAAGHNPSNAAIGVTRGALTKLNRAELQGIVAHEFSHILNGDMRLNVRLMGLLFGLLVIAIIGRTLLRFSSRGGGRKGSALPFVMVAAAIVMIGYVGLFFGRLIQAAVSRHRESLADASAVQFTRDPFGLRGALVKVGAIEEGSRLVSPKADEVAHMLFAPGMKRFFSTHPSLLERLKAIDPRFDSKEFEEARRRMAAGAARQVEAEAAKPEPARDRLESLLKMPAAVPATVASLVGSPATVHIQLAREIRESLPPVIVSAGSQPQPARALLLSLALDSDREVRERQRAFISVQLGAGVMEAIDQLQSAVDALQAEQRMPALLRAFPSLRQLTRDERMQLMSSLNGMLQREGRVSLQSYVLRKLAQVHLRDDLEPAKRVRQLPLSVLQNEVQVLFSVLSQHGHTDEATARRAYEVGTHHLFPRERPAFTAVANWPGSLDLALSRLDQLMPVAKEQLIEAMTKTIMHDQQLTIGEAELLRAVCAALHCPLPPLVRT